MRPGWTIYSYFGCCLLLPIYSSKRGRARLPRWCWQSRFTQASGRGTVPTYFEHGKSDESTTGLCDMRYRIGLEIVDIFLRPSDFINFTTGSRSAFGGHCTEAASAHTDTNEDMLLRAHSKCI